MPRKPHNAKRAAESAESPDSARWRRRKNARPQEILDAALSVFAERGFAAARLEEIAARAGVAKGTIYLYFDSKKAVFQALIAERLGGKLDAMAGIARGHHGPIAPLLAQILRALGQFLVTSEYVVLPKIVIAEAGNFPDLARAYREDVAARGLALLEGVIGEGQARGEFRPMPPEHAARLAVAPLVVIAIWRTTFAGFDPTPYDYEGLIEAHIATLLAGFTGKPAT